MEYRICWSANSNITFHGATDWQDWAETGGDPDATSDDIENIMSSEGGSGMVYGLEDAINGSGFEWWVETR
jgi:hypothetical protein